MNNPLQANFLKAVASLDLKKPVTHIHEKTGYSTGLISEYLNEKKDVSEKFAKKFCEVYGFDFEEMNSNPEFEVKEPDTEYNKKSPAQKLKQHGASILKTFLSKEVTEDIDSNVTAVVHNFQQVLEEMIKLAEERKKNNKKNK